MFPERFFWKTFSSLLACILLSSGLFSIFLYRHLYETTLNNLKQSLQKETEILAAMMLNNPELIKDPRQVAALVHTEDRITVIAPDGTVLADNWADRLGEPLENHSNRPEFQSAMHGEPEFVERYSHTMQRMMIYYGVPIRQQNQNVCVLRLSFSLSSFLDQMVSVRNFLIGAALLAILLSLPLTFVLSATAMQPIRALIESANRLASGQLNEPARPLGAREFRDLAHAFNRMASQLQEKIVSIQQEHGRMETLLSRMVEGVLAMDNKGRALFANAAFCEMAGIMSEKLAGKSYLEVVRNDQLAEYIARLLRQEFTETRHLEAQDIQLLGAAGPRIFSVQASRIREENTNIALILVFHDITKIKKVEQIRRDFVANVSHEFRTPLTALKGSTEVLLDGAYQDAAQCKKFLEIMDKQLSSLQNLVNDMLKLAFVEDLRSPLRRETVDVQDLVSDVTSLLEPLATRKKQQIQASVPAEPLEVIVDPQQIKDALMNLVDNAIKYSEEKARIEIRVEKKNGLQIQVKDNGPGIPQDQLSRIFERFYRVDKSRSREMGGTGLGLAIVRHCVENHGGTVTAESSSGTTFTIHLPASVLA